MPSRLQRRVADILEIPSPPGDVPGRVFDVSITTLIALNAVAVVLETVPGIHAQYGAWFTAFELVSVTVFLVEYALRLWIAPVYPEYSDPVRGRVRFALTPMAVIDALAILPGLILPFLDLRFLRVLRLLRLLKLSRYSESLQIFVNVVASRGREITMALFLVGLALIMTSSFMYYAEHDAQPEEFGSIPQAFYWSIVTLTTVGYGDVVPVTVAGKMLAGVTAILGVGVIALPVGILASGFVTELEKRGKKKAQPCPHCGKDVHAPPTAAPAETVSVRRL